MEERLTTTITHDAKMLIEELEEKVRKTKAVMNSMIKLLAMDFSQDTYFNCAELLTKLMEPDAMSEEELSAFQVAIVWCRRNGLKFKQAWETDIYKIAMDGKEPA